MKLAYQYKLLPTDEQRCRMDRWLEILRCQYNKGDKNGKRREYVTMPYEGSKRSCLLEKLHSLPQR